MFGVPKSLTAIFDKNEQLFLDSFKEKDLSYLDPSGRSLLINAILENQSSVAKFLLKYRELLDKGDKKGLLPLHYCALKNNVDIARLLLKKGIDIDAIDNFGNTALWKAVFEAKEENYEIVALLIEMGANPVLKNHYGVSPLDFAKQVQDERLVSILQKDIDQTR